MSGAYYDRFLLEIHQEMAERLQVPLILHICGRTVDRMEGIAKSNMAAFHFDSKNDPQESMDLVDGGIRLVGNINNPVTLYSKGPEEVRAEVYRALDAGVELIAPECAIPLATKLENLLEIPQAVKDWHEERDGETATARTNESNAIPGRSLFSLKRLIDNKSRGSFHFR